MIIKKKNGFANVPTGCLLFTMKKKELTSVMMAADEKNHMERNNTPHYLRKQYLP